MLNRNKKLNQSDESGQALFEFIAFIPFLMMLYSLTLTISNSLNASINQQKSTRGYFYYLNQNDSRFPSASREEADVTENFSLFSMSIIGWANSFDGRTPVAPCFELKIPIGDIEGDSCSKSYSEDKTQFIRVGTVYGVCGASYAREGKRVGIIPFSNTGSNNMVTDLTAGCALIQ